MAEYKPKRHGVTPSAKPRRSNLPLVDLVQPERPRIQPVGATKQAETVPLRETVRVFCPKCGNGFSHQRTSAGKAAGGISGAAAGAAIGAKFGIAGGPLGAIAGTIPGAILGALFGSNKGSVLDQAKCPKCSTSFDAPATK
jgi:ribosomal protein S27AE